MAEDLKSPQKKKPQEKGTGQPDDWSEVCQQYCSLCLEKHQARACAGRRDDEGEFQIERW